MPVSVIAFDLDGTLIDSNPVKRRGFDHVFANFNDGAAIVARVLETHRKAFRTVVIRLVLEQLQAAGEPGCEPTDERVAELAARYNRFCIDGAVACPEIAGAEVMLKFLSQAGHRLFINTATATDAAKEVIQRRAWNGFFVGILGFPPEKVANLEEISRLTGTTCHEIAMVGDDDQDMIAAEAFGCRFIGLRSATSHFTETPPVIMDRLNELPSRLAY